MAKVKDSDPSGARHLTGTLEFMAIEVLNKVDHTYRHDLESFLYVLLRMCAREAWGKFKFSQGGRPPRDSRLRYWAAGTLESMATFKAYDMSLNSFDCVMDEFPRALDVVKPLCVKIRSILFGDAPRTNYGTPAGDPDQLYRPIIAAYDDAIRKLSDGS